MVSFSIAGYEPYKAYIREAIEKCEKEKVLSWNDQSGCIEASAISERNPQFKKVVREVLDEAKKLYMQANGYQTLVVSIAVDGRIDVEICVPEYASPMEIRAAALQEFEKADISNMECVKATAVNVSGASGDLLYDF